MASLSRSNVEESNGSVYWFSGGVGVRYRFAGAVLLFGGIAVWSGLREGLFTGLGVFFLGTPLFVIMCVGYSTVMDVRLDEGGIAKIAFGRVWRSIAWKDIEKVVLRPLPGGATCKDETALQIHPRQTHRLHRIRMCMGLDMGRASQFVTQFNAGLAQHAVPVEDHRSGRARTVRQVVLN